MPEKHWSIAHTFLFFENKNEFPHRVCRKFIRTLSSTDPGETLCMLGLTSLTHRPLSQDAAAFKSGRMLSISLGPEEIAQATPLPGKGKDAFLPIMEILLHRMQAVYQQVGITGVTLMGLDLLSIPDLEAVIWSHRKAFPQQCLIVVTTLPAADQRGPELEDIGKKLISLQQQGAFTAALLLDVLSPAASGLYGYVQQEQFVVQSLTELLLQYTHDIHNPTPEQVFARLGSLSPLIGVAVASTNISVGGRADKNWELMRKLIPNLPPRGEGDLLEVVAKAKNLTRFVLTEPAACTSRIAVDTNYPFFLMISIPIRHSDERFDDIANELRRFLSSNFPQGNALFMRGTGRPDRSGQGGYALVATAMYPLSPSIFVRTAATHTLKNQ